MTVSRKLYGFNFCCLTKSAANIAKIIGPHTLLLKFNEVIFQECEIMCEDCEISGVPILI